MFCTQLDLSPQRLPGLYPALRGITGPRMSGAALPGIDGPKKESDWGGAGEGRGGRVLLSTGGAEDFSEGKGKGEGGGMQGQRRVTLTRNPEPGTRNPEPETRNPKPETRKT